MILQHTSTATATPKERGKRLKKLRESLRLTRREFAEKHQIPLGTMQNWEDGRYNGIGEKGAERICSAFQAEGINCRVEWLLYGMNPPQLPKLVMPENKDVEAQPQYSAQQNLSEEEIIAEDLTAFHNHYQNGIDFIVVDDSMEPIYLPGDHVAGKRRFKQEINNVLGKGCIVQIDGGETLVRTVKKGSKPDTFTLLSKNPTTQDINHQDIKLFSAAPIIWLRRKDKP